VILKSLRRYALPITTLLVYGFLYLPIVVLVVFSFNSVAFPYHWISFSWQWYYELFHAPEIWDAVRNSLVVASAAVLLSVSLGVLFVFYSAQSRMKKVLPLFYGTLIIPEIVLAVGLLSLFTYFSVPLSLMTLIAGHTLIGLGYVIPIVYARFLEIDRSIIEASLDLGATIHQTFLRVVLPLLTPALIAASLLVFIVSFDDFLIAFFCTGTSSQTLSLYIFSMIRAGVSPTINALSTLMIALSSLLVLLFCSLQTRVKVF
jgi:spermidine/putrescine transport system permease protein